ncbi:hypothetical protein Q4517_13690 [Tenacibaculum sp. 1_MG-2023]|uniref:hypothetical protein n=1 Tax=Tenacibaculum sp. 1_MG-2023 TaxID=3062653 RepID=UPI0026E23BBA|nr:hypothetical protein [Tenacibaculum sp. 1_MG-2023]MDO6676596.1 hypothetical protein [Tenacibaculum sp. 1_MG-2023]
MFYKSPNTNKKLEGKELKKKLKAKKTGETESYTFKGSNNTSTKARKEKIATIIYKNIKGGLQKKQQQTTVAHIVEVLKKDSYTKGDCIDIPLILPKIEFTKLANANLGDEVYMVVETENMANKRIKLSLKQAEKDCLVAKDSSIVLQQDSKKTSVVETYVSRFTEQNKKNISNAEDFRNFAIDAVTLSPKDEKDQKKYREALNKTTDKKTKLFMVVDAEPENQNWFEVKYEEFFDNRPNLWYYGEGKWFELINQNIINIYHTGEISKLDFKGLKEVSYIYHDKEGGKHSLGNFDVIEVDKLKKGKTLSSNRFREDEEKEEDKQTAVKTITYDKEGVDAEETRIYSDGDIITKGSFRIKYRIYEKGTGKVKLVKMKEVNYSKGNTKIKFTFHETLRVYSNPELFAGFLGALAKCGFNDVKSTGSSYEDSSCYPSTTHVNGQSIDTCYLSKKTDEQKFINALWDFGFKLHYVGSSMSYTHGTKDKYHNDHLHSGSFTPNYKK